MSTPKTLRGDGKGQTPGINMVVGVSAPPGQGTVTARQAGGLVDMQLSVDLRSASTRKVLQNIRKAINLALQSDFIETDLDEVYKAARVWKGTVQILHKDYIGLGDGMVAQVGKSLRSFQLTLQGPDPASPEGKRWLAEHGSGLRPIRGVLDMVGRKLNLLQEFEDKVPTYVAQMLDRLEAAKMITGWRLDDWEITTDTVGLDVTLKPLVTDEDRKAAGDGDSGKGGSDADD